MFRGFSGYIQADAHAIYDALFRGEAVEDGDVPPTEVGCWSHVRRRFWEAGISGFSVGREGLLRIRKLYQLDQSWSELPPAARLKKRQTVLRSLVDEFFAWAQAQSDLTSQERGLVTKALGYAIRQQLALRRFLDDGRLRMDNNSSENALRVIATGRKAWLFFGSDDHAEAETSARRRLLGRVRREGRHGDRAELELELSRIEPRASVRPVRGSELEVTLAGPERQDADHLREVALRVDAVEFAGGDQGVEVGGAVHSRRDYRLRSRIHQYRGGCTGYAAERLDVLARIRAIQR